MILTETQRRLLTTIFERGADSAAQALTRWLSRPCRLTLGAIEQVPLETACELLGPGDSLLAAAAMQVFGALRGEILLVFEDRAGLALVDVLLRQPPGTTETWGELEQSAACETANIVGCAYLNSLAAHLPARVEGDDAANAITPGPPGFRHEFAASLLEFALMDQAAASDHLLVIETTFTADGATLDWTLLFVPDGESLQMLGRALDGPRHGDDGPG
jgi:chemotaxis protein CheC